MQGGPDGVDNIALKQLGNRTRYLKDRADAADKVASGLGTRADATDRKVADLGTRADATDKKVADLGTRADATDKKVADLGTRADAADKKIGDLGNDKVAKAGDALKGKLLGKVGAITPNNTNNAGFAFDGDPDTGMFSPADGHLQLGAQGVPYVVMLSNNLTLGAAGWLSFIAGKTERGRITAEGRWLVGGAADDGSSTMLVQNPATGYAIAARRPDIGAQYLALGAAAGIGNNPKDNTVASYSDPGAAKSLIIAASTDDANTTPTNGALGIRFTILDITRAQIGQTGNMIVGTSAADRETGRLQVVADATGYAVVAYRTGNAAQYIGIGAAPDGPGGVIDNYIDAYSQTAAGKILYLNSTTDANNTTPTGGRLGIGFNILGKTKMMLNQAGRLLIGEVADDGSSLVRVGGTVTATAPPAGDRSDKLITSAWFAAAVANVQIGQIVWEARTAPRAGFLKLNGTELKRTDYPLLWAYAQASGAIVADADWGKGRHGCFSTGDGNTTFRLPDLRGEFIRCWDDARGADAQRQIGSWQDSQNRSHAHGASAAAVGDHSHSAWTDAQGVHAHGVNDPGHSHTTRIGRVGVTGTSFGQGSGPYNWDRGDDIGSSVSGTNISIAADGNHGHNVGIGAAGAHSHTISVAADGGNETRPRNVALLAMIRAY
ncbi:hypothetical protein WS52_18750 [Burkholderia territorii]|nr:hypothetical protein WS52_18750 [Burkholderia territorii]KUZ46111.1 hypothetical protein WS53_27940 [Burkholderia territorii]